MNRAARVGKVVGAVLSAVTLIVTGVGWITARSASAGITTSDALTDEIPSIGTDQNILIMGLDSRRDQQGRTLPQDVYDALHAGDENSGSYDADLLIVVHLPADGGPVTAISIPRDDYVDLAGCPGSECQGKVKEAYRFAYEHVIDAAGSGALPTATNSDGTEISPTQEQLAREAGRKAQISTVKSLLQIPIDHFIEVTLAAFVQIARLVQPITVCLNEDTSDPYYSGADFHKGVQQINAAQAMSFVRQRRDVNDASFTDLDRTRRQQAFIASLLGALRRSGALSSPTRLSGLLDVARQNVAVDQALDLDGLIKNASSLTDRAVDLYTLPVNDFSEISDGEDVNIVDVPTIRSIVHDLLSSESSSTPPTTDDVGAATGSNDTAAPTAPGVVLNVINASRQKGMGAALEASLGKGRFLRGTASTADATSQTSTIAYGHGAQASAAALADELGLSAIASDTVAPDTVQLTVGTDFEHLGYLDHAPTPSDSLSSDRTTPVTTVPATGTGSRAPAPTNLSRMSGDDIPCVK